MPSTVRQENKLISVQSYRHRGNTKDSLTPGKCNHGHVSAGTCPTAFCAEPDGRASGPPGVPRGIRWVTREKHKQRMQVTALESEKC